MCFMNICISMPSKYMNCVLKKAEKGNMKGGVRTEIRTEDLKNKSLQLYH